MVTKDQSRNRCPKQHSEPANEIDEAVHAGVVLDAEHLRDGRRKERIVSARPHAVKHDERNETRSVGVIPQGEHRYRGEDDLREAIARQSRCRGGARRLTLKTNVFWRPTRSARIPIAMRAALFTAALTASRRLPVPLEYARIETEYVVRKYVGTMFPAACRNAPRDCR